MLGKTESPNDCYCVASRYAQRLLMITVLNWAVFLWAMIMSEITHLNPLTLKPHPSNSKKHPKEQIDALADSIKRYGFNVPVVVRNGFILSGHGRVEASKQLKLHTVPCIIADHLSDDEARAFIIVDNRVSELGFWDKHKLEQELRALGDTMTIDMEKMRFDDLSADFNFGDERPEYPADRADRLGEYIEPDDDDFDEYDGDDDENDEPVLAEKPQKAEPISYTFLVVLDRKQQKRLSELKNGLSDKQFFLQNVLGESE